MIIIIMQVEAEVMLLLDLSLCRVCICVIHTSCCETNARYGVHTDIVSATWRLTRLTIHLSQNMTWWEI